MGESQKLTANAVEQLIKDTAALEKLDPVLTEKLLSYMAYAVGRPNLLGKLTWRDVLPA